MARPDPIEYAERLYGAIRAANFSPISFLAFGNAIKDGVAMRSMPRIAAEPFMRVVGEMLDLEEEVAGDDDHLTEAELILAPALHETAAPSPRSAATAEASSTASEVVPPETDAPLTDWVLPAAASDPSTATGAPSAALATSGATPSTTAKAARRKGTDTRS